MHTTAQTCTDAGKGPGDCLWSTNPPSNCYVSGGNCYCDFACATVNDCCSDVGKLVWYGMHIKSCVLATRKLPD